MDWIDLHVHTLASDGADAPEAVVARAAALGLRAVAITDHDTFSGLDEAARAGARHGVEVAPGVELSTGWEGLDIHLLGYYMDTGHPALRALMERSTRARIGRNEKLVQKLHDAGYPITMEALRGMFPGQTMLGRPHVADYLMRLGYVSSVMEGVRGLMGRGKPFYIPREHIPLADAAGAVRAAGGVPVLAHPFQYRCTDEAQRLRLIDAAADCGVRGLEAMYSDHTPEQTALAESWAAARGMLCTGGSDYHGARKPDIALGIGRGDLRVPYGWLTALRAAAGI